MTARQRPAIEGGPAVSDEFIPVACPTLGQGEIDEVVSTLQSGWLATGGRTATFEKRFAAYAGTTHALGANSGTAALGLALAAVGIGQGDEVICPSMTFAATAHQVVLLGARPVFADVDPLTFNLLPRAVEQRITPRTRALLPVHFAGRPCEMDALRFLADKYALALISDAAHAIEARYHQRGLAQLSDISAYSFHPCKNLTTGEGGMVATDNAGWHHKMELLRFHGISRGARADSSRGDADWDVVCVGHKANMSDLQAAIGLHQLEALEQNHRRRAEVWRIYNQCLSALPHIALPESCGEENRHAMHMYNIVLQLEHLRIDRDHFCAALKAENIGTGVHYRSLHRTSYYRSLLKLEDIDLPNTAYLSDRILTLPLYPTLTRKECSRVCQAVEKLVNYYQK